MLVDAFVKKSLSMKKNYLLIVFSLFVSYMMLSWTTVIVGSKLVKANTNINYVELHTPEFETLFENPIQLFSLEKFKETSFETLAVVSDFTATPSGGNWNDV